MHGKASAAARHLSFSSLNLPLVYLLHDSTFVESVWLLADLRELYAENKLKESTVNYCIHIR